MRVKRRMTQQQQTKRALLQTVMLRLLIGGSVTWYLLVRWLSYTHEDPIQAVSSSSSGELIIIGPCAINLYGLPRKFKEMVLPSLLANVILPNAKYQCDYYVHYYDRREENDYRGADVGRAGTIDPEEVKLLTAAVDNAHSSPRPSVVFQKETEQDFFQRYNPLLQRIHTERGPDGKLLFIPLSEEKPFPNRTITNIIKMWHSQQSVWDLMHTQKHYSRVAMLRSDVLYVSPIDIYKLPPDNRIDYENSYSVIPNFGNFPVNDRMIYGPADAVRIWAAGRFRRLDHHVEKVHDKLDGIHPERFLFHTLFPAIRDAGIPILAATPNLCFLRVRSDWSVRIQDCGRDCVNDNNILAIEHILQRPCELNRTNPKLAILECNDRIQAKRNGPFVKHQWKSCPWKA